MSNRILVYLKKQESEKKLSYTSSQLESSEQELNEQIGCTIGEIVEAYLSEVSLLYIVLCVLAYNACSWFDYTVYYEIYVSFYYRVRMN